MPEHVARVAIGDGSELLAFDELDVSIDMLAPGSPWSLTLWYSEQTESAWKVTKTRARVEETVTVSIDGAVQLRGRIERASTRTSRDGKTLTVSGRDLAARAMDWDADPRIAFRDRTLEEGLQRLFEDVGITPVIVDGARQVELQARPARARAQRTSTTRRRTRRARPFDGFKVREGEKIWQVASQLCRRLGYMIWSAPAPANGQAAIVVDAPATSGEPLYALERRARPDGSCEGNILESEYALDGSDVPTLVTSFSATSAHSADDAHGRVITVNTAYRDHPQVARRTFEGSTTSALLPKPRYIKPQRCRTVADAEKAAERVIAEAMADFEVYECTVRGWGQNGVLYAVNAVARLRDDTDLPPLDGHWLITRVAFHRSRAGGTTTRLRLVPLGAIRVYPEEGP